MACPAIADTTLADVTGVATAIAPAVLLIVVPSGFTPPRMLLVAVGSV
jgi:hypothetical protein